VDIYRDQLAELESELRDERLTEDRFLRDREELMHRMATDLRIRSSPSAKGWHASDPGPLSRTSEYQEKALLWLGMMVSLAAVLLYLAIGSPSSVPQTW
jgi:cytochrome c-type biogenesis protein CcmI